MEFIDLKTQQQKIRARLDKRIQAVLDHGQYILGPEVTELESKLASWLSVDHAITCANGTDALLLTLMAAGVGPGDEVITSSFTFLANVEMICLLGAKPVFVDINPKTYNIDPDSIEKAISKKTKAIMPVSLYGQCAELIKIQELGAAHKIVVIEDAAQSFGAVHHGRKSCAINQMSATSFFPSKSLGCYGDGGAVFTTDAKYADLLKKIRTHGQAGRYNHVVLGVNSRLDTLQAAVLLEKLAIFDEEVELRQTVAKRYSEKLKGKVKVPFVHDYNLSVFAQYTIEVENRKSVQEHLQAKGIPTAVHYPTPAHLQPAFTSLGYKKGSLPISEHASEKVMSLPMHPYLSTEDQDRVVQALTTFG